MFDIFRNNMKVLMALLMLLIIPSFVFFGIQGYTRFIEEADPVARVAGQRITRSQLEAAHRREVERLAALSPGIDRTVLESDAAKRATLERLVDEVVLTQAMQDKRLLTTDRRLAAELMRDPTIAALRKPDGTLDVQRYQDLLRAQGLSVEQFENGVRLDMARRAVLRAVSDSAWVPRSAVELATQAIFEQREVAVAFFRPADYLASVQLSDDEVRAHYEAHADDFRQPERASVEYLIFDLDALAARLTVDEAELRAYYEQNVADTSRAEQRRARHILLQLSPDAAADEKARVRAQAQALLEQLRAQPQRFAEIAKAQSQDPGSAAQGGDLGWFGRGAMVKAFEDAVFAMKKGEIAGPVETEFGLHIIQLDDIRRPAPEPFDKARPRIEAELRRQQAQRRFAEEAERFSNLVYEQPQSLEPAAQALGLRVRRATVERNGPVGGEADPVLREPRVLQAIFDEAAISQKHNSAAIDLGGNRLLSVRVVEHQPALRQPFEAVATTVREQLRRQRAEAAARASAHEQADKQAAALQPPVIVSRQNTQGLPLAVVRTAMSAPLSGDDPVWRVADLGADGAAVLRVRRGPARAPVAAQRQEQEQQELARLWGEGETRAYLAALREHYRAQILLK
jgi:peptidyl-prolyl cis-trans isomerase D